MHIGFLTPEFPHEVTEKSGGLGTSIQNMTRAMACRGISISIFVYGQKTNKVIIDNKITIHIIAQKQFPFFSWFFYRKFLQTYINKKIELDNIDVIEAPDWTGITAFMKFKCPLVIRLNGSDGYFCYLDNIKQKFKNRFFEKIALNNADHIISVSEFTAKTTSHIFNLNSLITIIPNSIDIEKFKPLNELRNAKHILYFGTVIRKKGVLELAHIFNKIVKEEPKSQLSLIGKDVVDNIENRSTLEIFQEHLNEQSKVNCHYLDDVQYNDIKGYIARAEVVVLPSFAEALPMTWIEAMAMEKPIVTSNIGWAREVMINGVTGFTVNPKDHDEYAAKVLWLFKNPQKAKEMGEKAREYIELNFSSKVVAERNINYFKSILN